MGDYAFRQFIFREAGQGVEGSACLESTNLLVILAFEVEVYLRVGGGLAFPGSSFQGIRGLGVACQVGDGVAGYDWGLVDVLFDCRVGCLHRLAGQGGTLRWVGHGCGVERVGDMSSCYICDRLSMSC